MESHSRGKGYRHQRQKRKEEENGVCFILKSAASVEAGSSGKMRKRNYTCFTQKGPTPPFTNITGVPELHSAYKQTTNRCITHSKSPLKLPRHVERHITTASIRSHWCHISSTKRHFTHASLHQCYLPFLFHSHSWVQNHTNPVSQIPFSLPFLHCTSKPWSTSSGKAQRAGRRR